MRPKGFIVFKYKNYRFFWFTVFFSQIGLQMLNVTINWHMYDMTNSAINLGLLGLVGFAPILLFSLIGGVVADKMDRKKVMLGAQAMLTVAGFGIAYAALSGAVSPLVLYAVVAVSSLVTAFDLPARQSVIPSLVPKEYLVNAVGLTTLSRQVALIGGPSVAGFLIELFGVQSVYVLSTVFFFLSVILLLPVAIHHHLSREEVEFNILSVFEGIRFVRKTPLIYSTMLLDFFATFFASATVLLPIFAKDVLGIGAKGLGLLYAAPSIGAVTSGLLLTSLSHIKHQGRLLLAGVLLYGIATIGFGLSKSFYLSFFFLMLLGVGDMVSTVIRNTVRQLVTPDHLRGRMVSINMIFFTGGPYLGEAEAGLLAAALGAPMSVVIGGVATAIAAVAVAVFVPVLTNYMNHEDHLGKKKTEKD